MPYITDKVKVGLSPITDAFANCVIGSPGELNYLFTRVIMDYTINEGLTYQTINDVIGALEGAKMEFYRRVATPYEEGKIVLNGDVYV